METTAADASASTITRVDRGLLTQLSLKLLQRRGMFAAEAEIVVARLIEADLSGLFAEGVGSLPQFLDAMDAGDIDPRARMITRSETAAVMLLDGGTGIGHVAATRAVLLAIEKARAVGTGTVVVQNSRLCGDVGAIARLAAQAGLIGFVTNSFAEPGPDATGPASAWGIPTADGSAPLVLREQGGSITENSSLVLGVLSAGLAGGEPIVRKRKSTRVANTVEHFVQAIDPEQFGSRASLLAKWGPVLASSQTTMSANATPDDATLSTVPLQSGDARVLAELAAGIRFTVSW